MASPFPGMDPYLEEFWRDVHASLIIYARDQVQSRLPPGLRARVEERVVVEPAEGPERSIYPDVRIVERGRGRGLTAPLPQADAVAEPLVIVLSDEPMTETYLEIIDVGSGRRVVTVIEFLSHSNKLPGESREQYRLKIGELRLAGVSLVEIDLLRAGKGGLCIAYERIPPTHRTTYHVCVSRGWRPFTREIYAVPLRQRLPVIRVPLREADADVPLDLQSLIDQCYRNGGYDADIDYRRRPAVPLEPEEQQWVDELLRSYGCEEA